jgi:hypothetical protein
LHNWLGKRKSIQGKGKTIEQEVQKEKPESDFFK